MDYEDFEVQIGPRGAEGVLVRALSPRGAGKGTLLLPAGQTGEAKDASRDIVQPAAAKPSPASLGGPLFRALLSGQVNDLFHQSLVWAESRAPRRGLRIVIRIDPRDQTLEDLRRVRWELLYREDTHDFLALSRATPVVRCLDIPRPSELTPVEPPLRILVVAAQSPGGRKLKLAEELVRLDSALRRGSGIEVEVLEQPDTDLLREALHRAPFHVLHYMGHGLFDPGSGEGALLFGGDRNGRSSVSGRHLATKLKDASTSLRLVLLNACDTALAGPYGKEAMGGVANALVLGGIPAVLAMQSPIADSHAVAFSTAFYTHLVGGARVEEAVVEGRHAIHDLDPDGGEWAVPVLFLRTAAGADLFAGLTRRPTGQTEAPPRRSGKRLAGAAMVLLLAGSTTGLLLHWPETDGTSMKGTDSSPRVTPLEPSPIPVREEAATPAPAPPQSTPREQGAVPTRARPSAGRRITVGEGAGAMHFDIVGEVAPPFDEGLQQAAGLAAAGRTFRIEMESPDVSTHVQEGLTFYACSLNCQIYEGVRVIGSTGATLSRARGEAACREAAGMLAENVIEKLSSTL